MGRTALKEQIASSYYDLGRFCSAHHQSSLVLSLCTILLLSYPAISRIRLPSTSPMEVYWTMVDDDPSQAVLSDPPDWLKSSPTVHVQQIIVRGRVHPWDSGKLDPIMGANIQAVKGPISRAFTVLKRLRQLPNADRVETQCFHVHTLPVTPLLPGHGCLVLSPTLFWSNDEDLFFRDDDVLATIFTPSCTPSTCPRELLLGLPTRLTGIRSSYQTNRQRSIDYSITVMLFRYNPDFISGLKDALITLDDFNLIQSKRADESTFVHVYYRPSKHLSDYVLPVTSYALFLLYVYFSASKLSMVGSKWVLASAAVVTVGSTISVTLGICLQLDLTPALWGAELFPYLAMIIGFENTLCITRSVVSTPACLPVLERLARGLSQEGYSITKHFLFELTILSAGWLTFVAEIQELCTFAVVGLFVDFYLRLLFYMPCLTLDLLRLERVSSRQSSTVPCPIRRLCHPLFLKRRSVVQWTSSPPTANCSSPPDRVSRRRSESQLGGNTESTSSVHRRTVSHSSVVIADPFLVPPAASNRFGIVAYWTKSRFSRRLMLALTALWIVWLVFVVRRWRWGGQDVHPSTTGDDYSMSRHWVETAPLEWVDWKLRTFKWWPVLFDQYNTSLSGHYVTFLPPIVLEATVGFRLLVVMTATNRRCLPTTPAFCTVEVRKSHLSKNVHLWLTNWSMKQRQVRNDVLCTRYRISSLEVQMTIALVLSFGLFATVAGFIIYVCFLGTFRPRTTKTKRKIDRRVGSRIIVESIPLVFTGQHDMDVECLSVDRSGDLLVTACLGGRLIIWDGTTADCLHRSTRSTTPARIFGLSVCESDMDSGDNQFRRRAVSNVDNGNRIATDDKMFAHFFDTSNGPPQIPTTPSSIWSMTIQQNLILVGCSNGSVEIWNLLSGHLIGVYARNPMGVTYVKVKGSRLVVVRFNGTVDFVELRFAANEQTPRLVNCSHLNTVTAHQLPINCVHLSALSAITASDDHTLKLFDLRSCRITHTLHGHNAPVLSVCLDEAMQMVYSCCSQTSICCWDLIDGQLLRTLDDDDHLGRLFGPVELVVTDSWMVGYGPDDRLRIWHKDSGKLATSIGGKDNENEDSKVNDNGRQPLLVALDDQSVATAYGSTVAFWDLDLKVLLKKVVLNGSSWVFVSLLLSIDRSSVVCCKGRQVYRFANPVIRFK